MKVVGIIAEYNPFHNGHKYQIDTLREKTQADYVIVAMSGNFLQRGVPALCDKFSRTDMALKNGADLVIELPTLWSTASAEYFAHGGVELLKNTGVVTHLGFGAETDDLEAIKQVSSILKEEPDIFQESLSLSLRKGEPFPVARKNALIAALPMFQKQQLETLLDSPNNILALEYLKALPETIKPILIPRKGAGYHDTNIQAVLPSASAIRDTIFCDDKIDLNALSAAMPSSAFEILLKLIDQNNILDCSDFSEMLGFCLLSLAQDGYASFADCTTDLSNKIKKLVKEYISFDSFAHKLKSKDMTYTRVSRCLLHILLNIKQSDYSLQQTTGFAPYIRVLGFRKDSSLLLSSIKKEASVPLITKVADAASILDKETYTLFEKDLFASNLYYQRLAGKTHTNPMNEFTNQIVIV